MLIHRPLKIPIKNCNWCCTRNCTLLTLLTLLTLHCPHRFSFLFTPSRPFEQGAVSRDFWCMWSHLIHLRPARGPTSNIEHHYIYDIYDPMQYPPTSRFLIMVMIRPTISIPQCGWATRMPMQMAAHVRSVKRNVWCLYIPLVSKENAKIQHAKCALCLYTFKCVYFEKPKIRATWSWFPLHFSPDQATWWFWLIPFLWFFETKVRFKPPSNYGLLAK